MSTTPARMASYGCARPQCVAPNEHVSLGRTLLSREHGEELVLALSLERRDTEDLAGPQRERDVAERLAHPQAANLECRRPLGRELDPLPWRCRLGGPGRAATSAPSMNSTIFSSPPSLGTSVPTSPPSRRTVARSQCAITSRRRCVMNSDERPRSFCACITVKTRSARSEGSAAVISSRIRSCGSRASARARSSIRCIGSGTSSTCSREVDRRDRGRAGAVALPRRACR